MPKTGKPEDDATINSMGTTNMAATATAYRMKNDARAKKVLKDLSRMLKEAGVETKHPRLRDAVGAIFGYRNWEQLDASIGGMMKNLGPEDHELDAAHLASRKASQIAALTRIGVAEDRATDILAKLRPTGRTAEAVASSRRISLVSTGFDYHPYRLHRAWYDLPEMERDFDGSTSGAEDSLVEWAERRRMHPLDAAVCVRDSSENEENLDTALRVTHDSHIIVDVSAVVDDLAERDNGDEVFLGLAAMNERDLYVHFGANAFPSPYPHVGVEGAYVTCSKQGGTAGQTGLVEVKIACSMPFRNMLDLEDMPLEDAWQDIRDHLRGPYIAFDVAEGQTFEEGLASFAEKEGIEAASWSRFLEKPILAALNGVREMAMKEQVVADAVFGELEPSVAARLERATTEEKLLSTVAKFDEGQMMVRYLGRSAPASEVTTEAAPDYLPFHLRDDGFIQELLGDVRGYHGDRAPAIAAAMIDHILHNTAEGPESSFVVAECRSLMIRTLLGAIAFDVGRDSYKEPQIAAWREEAGTLIREAVADSSSSAMMNSPLVWLAAHMLGYADEAHSAWERAHGIPALQRDGVLEELKALADEEIAENGEDFAAVVDYFMRPTYELTATGNLRPQWDKWYTANDIMPRTPELEAFLADEDAPSPR
jgi:hypothetical protein